MGNCFLSVDFVVYALFCYFCQYVNEQVINIPILYDGIWYSTFILEAILQ